jgi:hypothetical protein
MKGLGGKMTRGDWIGVCVLLALGIVGFIGIGWVTKAPSGEEKNISCIGSYKFAVVRSVYSVSIAQIMPPVPCGGD